MNVSALRGQTAAAPRSDTACDRVAAVKRRLVATYLRGTDRAGGALMTFEIRTRCPHPDNWPSCVVCPSISFLPTQINICCDDGHVCSSSVFSFCSCGETLHFQLPMGSQLNLGSSAPSA